MNDLLISLIISICGPNNYHCQDYFVNCAVREAGEIREEYVQECLDEYEDSSSGLKPVDREGQDQE